MGKSGLWIKFSDAWLWVLEGCWLGGSHRNDFGGNVGGSGLVGWIFLGGISQRVG